MIGIVRLIIVTLLLLGAPNDALVDRDHSLPSWYAPGEQQEAREALEALIDSLDYPVDVFSGFRSYQEQLEAYETLVKKEGLERADQVIARAGHSEHQLGTAFDLAWVGLPVEFNVPRNRRLWSDLEANAHKYGFVISFPLKEIDQWPYDNRWYPAVTEFRWEPWHLRFVGVELATKIVEAGYLDPTSPVLPQDFYEPWP
ncbi:MAG: hypothetical protein GTO18_11245 [Anaerolineales bacterium]|nr:hypothetical protein [Anaerolineales bacterium]